MFNQLDELVDAQNVFLFLFFFPVSSDGVSFSDKDPRSLARSSDGLILVAMYTH